MAKRNLTRFAMMGAPFLFYSEAIRLVSETFKIDPILASILVLGITFAWIKKWFSFGSGEGN